MTKRGHSGGAAGGTLDERPPLGDHEMRRLLRLLYPLLRLLQVMLLHSGYFHRDGLGRGRVVLPWAAWSSGSGAEDFLEVWVMHCRGWRFLDVFLQYTANRVS